MEDARELLQKAQEDRDEARTGEALLKVERDRAVQICATAVEERERLKRAFESLGKKYSLKKGQKSPETRVHRRKAPKGERRTSLSEDSDSPALADDAEGPAESPAPEYVHEGRCWKTSSTDRKVDTEQVGGDKVHQRQQWLLWSKGQLT